MNNPTQDLWKHEPFWKVPMTEREKWIARQWASFCLHSSLLLALLAGMLGWVLCLAFHE